MVLLINDRIIMTHNHKIFREWPISTVILPQTAMVNRVAEIFKQKVGSRLQKVENQCAKALFSL